MFSRPFHPASFLRRVYGTEPFRDYCRLRDIPFDQPSGEEDIDWWTAILAALPPDRQAQYELELAQVNELAGRDGNQHLLEAVQGDCFPSDDLPSGPTLALWFFVHRPALFQEVFFHHEVRDVHSWRGGKAAAGIAIGELSEKAASLGEELRRFFQRDAGTGRFCAVEAHHVANATCFAARVADRTQLVEGFSDGGTPTLQRVRPALTVLFAYSPKDGTVWLRSHLRSAERVSELYQCFGRVVLNADITCGGDTFHLDRLKLPFHPLPDAADMLGIRLKALHLRYPERFGRRCLKLETLSGDEPAAIDDLLRFHVGEPTTELQVCYAELQVTMRMNGRPKHYLIRLWPDRCSLDRSLLGDRLTACLRQWGLCHE